jgi:hypothetical protein
MRSSGEALPIQKLTTITTDRLFEVEEDHMYVELLVSFYSPAPDDDTNNFKKRDFYQYFGRNYTTMNELNWLFPLQKDIIHTRLVTSASYLHLHGREFNKIE